MSRCAACGGEILHSVCQYCETAAVAVETPVVRGVPERDFAALLEEENQKALAPLGEQSIQCQQCGACTSHPAALKAVECPFCASQTIVPCRPSAYAPRGILPFKISREGASEAIRGWSRKLWLRPSRLQNLAHLEEIRGIYVPFWTFDCRSRSRYEGVVVRSEEQTTGFWPFQKTQTVTVREPVEGGRNAEYDDLLVCASRGLDRKHIASIEPFHTVTQLVEYRDDYLKGWSAEESTMGPSEAWTHAEEHLRLCEYRKSVEFNRSRGTPELTMTYRFEEKRGKPVMLPLYVAAYRYAGKSYRVLVNGETGAVAGEAPYDWLKLILLALVLIPLLVLLTVATMGTNWFFIGLVAGALHLKSWWKERQRERANVKRPSG